jgi:hypothetical protein
MHIVRAVALMAGVLLCAHSSWAVEKWQHRLTVAAHPTVRVGNVEVERIVSSINAVISASKYGNPWDAPCPDVEFVRNGAVIADRELPLDGTWESLAQDLKRIAPQANVLIVLNVVCDGFDAQGCDRVGMEPLIVTPYEGFDDQLWLHERGHSIGLHHSAESPTLDSEVTADVGKRFMFWSLGEGHLGKVPNECAKFTAPTFGSVVKTTVPDATPMFASAASSDTAGSPAVSDNVVPARKRDTAETVLPTEGLTPRAYQVVAPPWLHGVPLTAIQSLSKEDVDSIRKMLRGPVNTYWPQALSALAAAGQEEDIALIKAAVESPMTTLLPDGERASAAQSRAALRVKLAAPAALGVIAHRFHSQSAVESLKRVAEMESARSIAGSDIAAEFSKQALRGLSLANTQESRTFINALKDRSPGSTASKVAPLTMQEENRLFQNATTVNSPAKLDAFLRGAVQ